MKVYLGLVSTVFLMLCSGSILACTPFSDLKPPEQAMREALDRSNAAFIATLVVVEKYIYPLPFAPFDIYSGTIDVRAERAIFKIDRVYKGAYKPGEYYKTETMVQGGSCGISALDIDIEDLRAYGHSRQWLIFDDSARPNYLTYHPSMPVEDAKGFGFLKVLDRLPPPSPAKSSNMERCCNRMGALDSIGCLFFAESVGLTWQCRRY